MQTDTICEERAGYNASSFDKHVIPPEDLHPYGWINPGHTWVIQSKTPGLWLQAHAWQQAVLNMLYTQQRKHQTQAEFEFYAMDFPEPVCKTGYCGHFKTFFDTVKMDVVFYMVDMEWHYIKERDMSVPTGNMVERLCNLTRQDPHGGAHIQENVFWPQPRSSDGNKQNKRKPQDKKKQKKKKDDKREPTQLTILDKIGVQLMDMEFQKKAKIIALQYELLREAQQQEGSEEAAALAKKTQAVKMSEEADKQIHAELNELEGVATEQITVGGDDARSGEASKYTFM